MAKKRTWKGSVWNWICLEAECADLPGTAVLKLPTQGGMNPVRHARLSFRCEDGFKGEDLLKVRRLWDEWRHGWLTDWKRMGERETFLPDGYQLRGETWLEDAKGKVLYADRGFERLRARYASA